MSVLGTYPRSRGAIAARRLARRGEQPRLRSSDLQLLAWLSEQYGAPATQLEALLGRAPCSGRSPAFATPASSRALGCSSEIRRG
jgi:hypothetical protein